MKSSKDYSAGLATFEWPDGYKVVFKMEGVNEEIKGKLALYGASVKIARAAARAKNAEEAKKLIAQAAEALMKTEWAQKSAGFGAKSKKSIVLEEIMSTKKDIRGRFVDSLRNAGVFKRLRITDEEVNDALKAPEPAE